MAQSWREVPAEVVEEVEVELTGQEIMTVAEVVPRVLMVSMVAEEELSAEQDCSKQALVEVVVLREVEHRLLFSKLVEEEEGYQQQGPRVKVWRKVWVEAFSDSPKGSELLAQSLLKLVMASTR